MGNRLLAGGLLMFVVLSATDFTQTYALIECGGRAYEANPVAAACLKESGWPGLAAFKAGTVAVLIGVTVLIAARNRRVAAALTAAACLVVLGVSLRSQTLLAETQPREEIAAGLAGSYLVLPAEPKAEPIIHPAPPQISEFD